MDSSNSREIHGSKVEEVADSDKRDRLSELPDFLILAILSLLPMPDVVATMILSKRWKHLWTTVPCLDFVSTRPAMTFDDLYEFQNFVSGALSHWKGSKILKFRICHDIDFIDSEIVDSCLLLAIENQAEEVVVDVGGHPNGYCPPQRLYSCSSVTKLYLSCILEIKEAVQWHQLRSFQKLSF